MVFFTMITTILVLTSSSKQWFYSLKATPTRNRGICGLSHVSSLSLRPSIDKWISSKRTDQHKGLWSSQSASPLLQSYSRTGTASMHRSLAESQSYLAMGHGIMESSQWSSLQRELSNEKSYVLSSLFRSSRNWSWRLSWCLTFWAVGYISLYHRSRSEQ